MKNATNLITAFAIVLAMSTLAWAQETPPAAEPQNESTLQTAQDEVQELSERVNQSEQAQQLRAGILKPIYSLAERFSFSSFHWVAFAVMAAGVVSFALQLTLGKLVVLSKLGFSPSEILSDVLGLAVSLIGLVLTTQAATENSNFTASAAAVISSAGVGVIAGFLFYFWGQRQELQALEGRRKAVHDQVATKPARN